MRKKIAFALLLLVFIAACSLPKKDSEVVAQVDNEKLTLAELKANFTEEEWQKMTPDQKKEYVQQWINLVILAKEAEKQGLVKEPAVKNRIKYAQQKVLANSLIASRLAAQEVSEEEMFNYYRIHQADFAVPNVNYKVQRIFVTEQNMLARVRQELQNGMRFEDAAKVFSQETLGQNGGYAGIVTPDGPDSILWQALSKVNMYEVITVPKDNGFYLLRAYETVQGTGPSGFESQKDIIRQRILDERKRQVYDELLQELKSKSNIYLTI